MRTATSLAALVLAVATVGVAAPAAHASTPDIITSSGGAAGWVSLSYLRQHPDAIPGGVQVVDEQPRFTETSAERCDGHACVKLIGDGMFVDRFETTYYSDGSEGHKNVYFQWWYATSSRVESLYHYDIFPQPHDVGKPGVYYDTQGPKGTFKDGTQACASWIPGNGVPCADIRR